MSNAYQSSNAGNNDEHDDHNTQGNQPPGERKSWWKRMKDKLKNLLKGKKKRPGQPQNDQVRTDGRHQQGQSLEDSKLPTETTVSKSQPDPTTVNRGYARRDAVSEQKETDGQQFKPLESNPVQTSPNASASQSNGHARSGGSSGMSDEHLQADLQRAASEAVTNLFAGIGRETTLIIHGNATAAGPNGETQIIGDPRLRSNAEFYSSLFGSMMGHNAPRPTTSGQPQQQGSERSEGSEDKGKGPARRSEDDQAR